MLPDCFPVLNCSLFPDYPTEKLTNFVVAVFLEVLSNKHRARPLDFDERRHKVLNSELKLLYTAITRARVNVWIFDENEKKRAPVFEYFKARRLVKSLHIKDISESSE